MPNSTIKGLFIAILVTAGISPVAMAEDGQFAVGIKGGTLGAGIEATIAMPVENINFRGQINGLKFDEDVQEDDVNYTGDLQLFTIGAIADYYIGGTGFRFSGGVYNNANKFSLTAEPVADTVEIGDTVYSTAEAGSVTAEIEFNSLSPYVGIGFGNALSDGGRFKINLDVGALYQGEPDASVSATGAFVLQADLDLAARQLSDEVSELKWYPVVAVGISYRF